MKLEKQIEIRGTNLFVKYLNAYSKKPTIIFLHDSLGCTKLWRDFPEKLGNATGCNYLVYDRLGYGKSDPMPTNPRPSNYLEIEADILNDLLTKLEIDSAILFGHSDGGSIALIAASKYPSRIKAILCESAHIFVEDLTLKGIYEAKDLYENSNLAERLEKYHGDKVDFLFKAWIETWTRSDFRAWNIEHFLPNISCPVLFIQGEADEYGTLAQVEKTVDQVKSKAEKYIIPNIGHSPHKEIPDLVLGRTIDFILQLTH